MQDDALPKGGSDVIWHIIQEKSLNADTRRAYEVQCSLAHLGLNRNYLATTLVPKTPMKLKMLMRLFHVFYKPLLVRKKPEEECVVTSNVPLVKEAQFILYKRQIKSYATFLCI